MNAPDDLLAAAVAVDGEQASRRPHDALFATLYVELKRLARRETRRHGASSPVGPTTLLHEAYLQIAHRESLTFPDQSHFLAYASRAMRSLVIDGVRQRAACKRGGGIDITSLDTLTAEALDDPQMLDEISEALDALALLEPELAHVVDLRFFCGFTMAEIAAQQGSCERTVQRQWEKARALLYHALKAA